MPAKFVAGEPAGLPPERQQAHPIQPVRGRDARSGDFGESRVVVDRMHRHSADGAALNFSGPPDQERNADAAFVGRALAGAQRRIAGHRLQAPVVGRENDDGVVRELPGIEGGEEPADVSIEVLQHREIFGARTFAEFSARYGRAPVAARGVFLDERRGGEQPRVRIEVGHIGEPRARAIPFDEANDVVGDGLYRLVFVRRAAKIEAVTVEVFSLVVSAQRRRVILVGDVPFAAEPGGVARGAQRVRECRDLRLQREVGARLAEQGVGSREFVDDFEHAGAGAVLPAEERCARRRALRFCVGIGETHALCGDPVEVRRGDVLVPETTRCRPSHVVGQNEKDVGATRSGLGGERQRSAEEQRKANQKFPPHGFASTLSTFTSRTLNAPRS